VHRGTLSISRQPDGGLRFLHGDGSNYGDVSVSPHAAGIRAKAFNALCTLGFREGESKRAVERAVGHAKCENVEDLLRRALRELDRPA
jgi:Holliday junction resolvasome RuvABC DNA-binding subunit